MEQATIERAALEASVATWRAAGDDRDSLMNLSVALYNLAGFYTQHHQYETAVGLLEEVVALDQHTNHPDLASDQATLEDIRHLAANLPIPTFADAIRIWHASGHDDDQFTALINLACALFVEAMRTGTPEEREELALDLAQIEAISSLPLVGSNDFVRVLQLYLRVQSEASEHIAQLEAALPESFAQALLDMQQAIEQPESVELVEPDTLDQSVFTEAFGNLAPEQQAELTVAAQVTPYLEQAMGLLRQPGSSASERFSYAEQLVVIADQIAEYEPDDSPWMRASHTLHLVASWLRGTKPDLTKLQQPYQGLIMLMVGGVEQE